MKTGKKAYEVRSTAKDTCEFGKLEAYASFVYDGIVYTKEAGDPGCARILCDDIYQCFSDDDLVFPIYLFEVNEQRIEKLKFDEEKGYTTFESLDIGTVFYIKDWFGVVGRPLVKICNDGPYFNAVVIGERHLAKIKPNEEVTVAKLS